MPLTQKMYFLPNLSRGDLHTHDSNRMSTYIPRDALPVGVVYEDLPITRTGSRLFFSALEQQGVPMAADDSDDGDEVQGGYATVLVADDEEYAVWLQVELAIPWVADTPIMPHELARIHASHPNFTYLSSLRADPLLVQATWAAHVRRYMPPVTCGDICTLLYTCAAPAHLHPDPPLAQMEDDQEYQQRCITAAASGAMVGLMASFKKGKGREAGRTVFKDRGASLHSRPLSRKSSHDEPPRKRSRSPREDKGRYQRSDKGHQRGENENFPVP